MQPNIDKIAEAGSNLLVHRFPALPLVHIHLKSYGDVSMQVPPNKQVVNVHGLKIFSTG